MINDDASSREREQLDEDTSYEEEDAGTPFLGGFKGVDKNASRNDDVGFIEAFPRQVVSS